MPINKRTIYIDTRNNQVRFSDWARVETKLGSMIEPWSLNRIDYKGLFDPDNACARIDEIQTTDIRKKFTFFGAGVVLHGGQQQPQDESY